MKKRKQLAISLAMIMVLNLMPINSFANDMAYTSELGVATQTDAMDSGILNQEELSQDNTEEFSPDIIQNKENDSISDDEILSDDSFENIDSVTHINMPAFSMSKTVDGVTVSVSAPEGVFPEDAYLSVISATEIVKKSIDYAIIAKRNENSNISSSYTFDIKVFDKDGNELQPADGNMVNVSFTTSEVSDVNLEADIYHISNTSGFISADKLSTSENGNTVSAQSSGFSYYTVEFTYCDKQYVMNGDTSLPLSEILDFVGINGEVSDVFVSNEELFSASNNSGEWIVTAHKAFKTNEWMKVIVDGNEYKIDVTDATTHTTSESNLQYSRGDIYVCNGSTYSFVNSGDNIFVRISETSTQTVHRNNVDVNISGTSLKIDNDSYSLSGNNNAWMLVYEESEWGSTYYHFEGTYVELIQKDATYVATTEFSYNGSSKTAVTGSNIDITGTNSATAVGDYTANVTPKSGHAWSDGSTDTKTVNWKIVKGTNPITYDSTQSVTKTYSTSAQTATLKTASNAEGAVTYSIQSQTSGNYFSLNGNTLTVKAGTPAGTYTVNVRATAAGNSNYNSGYKDSAVTVTIEKADMTVTSNGYTGTYNKTSHGITVSAPDGATVKYGISSSSYNLNESPKYTEASTYTIYYKVTKANYNDVTGSNTVKITPKEIGLTWSNTTIYCNS